jgi:hypothetical protein
MLLCRGLNLLEVGLLTLRMQLVQLVNGFAVTFLSFKGRNFLLFELVLQRPDLLGLLLLELLGLQKRILSRLLRGS